MTYGTLISTVTVAAGGATSITFGSGGTIPQTYTDLVLVLSEATDRANAVDQINLQFNGSASSYTDMVLYGTGSTSGSEAPASSFIYAYGNGGSQTANTFANFVYVIPNYASSTLTKVVLLDAVGENNSASGGWQNIVAGSWGSTSAITSIVLTVNYGTKFAQYTTASLYGIK